ncbi:hypothetical protein M422DRAFT_249515 [Sphaerobolus stellatus SS14]|uniref:Unplaced genomic scaffold SPHSTscaffold_30, whole genome shotgun sequence n=1 Tax=Sphaerobolus stellatus (strain SS14) TaxID=990650 RepID=A0A0C9VHM0_SPHS4|nr:hypothetical protein M422DRAFT_249515 [Sphaerobolus stellatus SS14]
MKITATLVFALLPYLTKGNPLQAAAGAKPGVVAAAYFATNQPDGNFVVSSEIGRDGKLTGVKAAFSADGVGSIITGVHSIPDPLLSQGSITVSGDKLYVVNAGSNSIAAFDIDTTDPTKLRRIGRAVNSGGEFPISVAVSQKRGLVCALNGGRINGVSCFKPNDSKGLVPVPNTQRLLNLNQTTPPNFALGNGFGQVLFNEAENQLLATVQRVNGTQRGFLAVWDVNPLTGALSKNFRELNVTGASLPFGMTILPEKNAALVTDPALGYEIFDLSGRNRSGIFPFQAEGAMNCWALHSQKTDHVFLIDFGTSLINEVAVDRNLGSSIVSQLALDKDSFLSDSQIATVHGNEYLYVLTLGKDLVTVLSLNGPGKTTVIQQFPLGDAVRKLGISEDPNQVQGFGVFVTGV